MRSTLERLKCNHRDPTVRVGDVWRAGSTCGSYIEITIVGDQDLENPVSDELEALAERAGWYLGYCPEHRARGAVQ